MTVEYDHWARLPLWLSSTEGECDSALQASIIGAVLFRDEDALAEHRKEHTVAVRTSPKGVIVGIDIDGQLIQLWTERPPYLTERQTKRRLLPD